MEAFITRIITFITIYILSILFIIEFVFDFIFIPLIYVVSGIQIEFGTVTSKIAHRFSNFKYVDL